MLKMKNVLKLSAGVIFASAFACQAFAEDVELTGTYGNYLKAGCGWSLSTSNNYGGGNTLITVDTYMLTCASGSYPEAVKIVQSNYNYVGYPYNTKTLVSQSCSLQGGASSVTGDCTNHRISK